MKNKTIVLSALMTTVLLAALPASFAARTTDKTTREEVSKEVEDAIEAIKGYSADQRDEAVARAKKLLEDIDVRIEKLEKRVEKQWAQTSERARNAARTTLKELRKKRNVVAEWYGGLQHSSDRAWDEIKTGLSDAYSDLSDAWKRAADKFDAKD